MNLYPVSIFLLFLCFLNGSRAATGNPTHFTGDISINCGSRGASAARSGREWLGDVRPKIKSSSLLQIKGSSATSSIIHKLISDGYDPVPYRTARISRSQFSYVFQVNPGQKFIRLHFNPTPYKGFERFKDLFTVEAGAFTLLSNFSASLTANALGVNSFVKEYCISIEESQQFNIIFTPASGQSLQSTYAFINGIEIISVPNGVSYFHREDIGVQVVGKSPVYVDNTTALEITRRLNIQRDSISSVDDIVDMFGMWETVPKRKASKMNNISWQTLVDVGFRYLVRLHFSQLRFKTARTAGVVFEVQINERIADDVLGEMDDEYSITPYRDYMVMMKGSKQESKQHLVICLQANHEFFDGDGPIKGFEIMKLSNADNSLASPNPLSSARDSSYRLIQLLLQFFGHRNMVATVAVTLLALVNIIIHTLRRIWEAITREEENMPSARAKRVCHQFSLAEIQLATKDFSDANLIGRGGFGNVYKGVIDNGRETVAIKRLKSNSKQGAREFLTEIETLTELRHVNLVSLIGYCNEQREMILVYEYMLCGTLDDHLYKHRDNDSSLSWKQRLNICIEAARGLDYLHSGRSLVHRDVKASNILLDENLTAKVSDFGLAKHLSKSKLQSHVSTKVKGTFGYFDPDYFKTGKLTKKSDTYAFGVVLLEVLSGRPVVDRSVPEDEQILIMWARESISKGKPEQIVASNLRGEVSEDSLKAFVGVAEKCLHDDPKKRPTMAQVVLQLEIALEQQESSEHPVEAIETNLSQQESSEHPVEAIKTNLSAILETQDTVIGFEDEVKKLVGFLTEETEQLDVISIIGMSGLGKTTLAGKIFHDPVIHYEFPTRIWVNVSQDFTRKNIFLAILKEFMRITDDMYKSSEGYLAHLVADHLESEKFLIVMDDVWRNEDWDDLQIAFPKSNKAGKVLITSRQEEVAYYANRNRPPHKLRFFTQDESWLLLRLAVFGQSECPRELEIIGKQIADQCDGLPLAIVIIGGILLQKPSTSDEMRSRRNAWRKLSETMSTYVSEDLLERMEKIIALSYDKLPHHLRACFLYFGMFPKDFEIPTWKLICMWIAEGFVQPKSGISMEETAEWYLEDLICRKLVRIEKMKSQGRVKTCRIHDMLHNFCKTAAGNFLQEMKSIHGVFEPPVFDLRKYHRLCIHSEISKFISLKPYTPQVYSFVSLSNGEIILPKETIKSFLASFELVRVLDVMPIRYTKIPSDLYLLVNLKYIALSTDSTVLPATFSKLLNIQTLIVKTTGWTLEIKADISKMIQLRHFKTNASATLPKAGKNSKGGENLQSLGTISPKSCTKEVFDRAKNLKKLGIRGRLALLLDGKIGSFDSLGKLSSLQKLKLLNDVFPYPPSEGQLRGLPQPYMFPPKLRSLTLADTFLDWTHMSIIGLLENLVVLKLKDKAVMGKIWEAADGGFRRLELLHIGRTDLVVWKASGHHFPRLRRLELRNCEELREVPVEIAGIPTLELLDVYRSKFTGPSAKRIREAIKKNREEAKLGGVFKLSIFPPDE